MRLFSCFIRHGRSSTPQLAFVLARDDQRARELARQQLSETPDGLSVEICENGQLLATLPAPGAQ